MSKKLTGMDRLAYQSMLHGYYSGIDAVVKVIVDNSLMSPRGIRELLCAHIPKEPDFEQEINNYVRRYEAYERAIKELGYGT